jgi:hypothetical protein
MVKEWPCVWSKLLDGSRYIHGWEYMGTLLTARHSELRRLILGYRTTQHGQAERGADNRDTNEKPASFSHVAGTLIPVINENTTDEV